MPTSESVQLPQELIELIIEDLATLEGDNGQRKAALKSCALTSWSFLSPARKHLFAELHLVEDDGPGEHITQIKQDRVKLERFLQLLVEDPCHDYPCQPLLSSHIRSLVIHFSQPYTMWRQCHSKRFLLQLSAQSLQGGHTRHSALAPILHLLCGPNVEKLCLSVKGPQTARCMWEALDEDVKHALLRYSFVTDLHIRDIYSLPAEVALNYTNLKSLSLEGVTIRDWDLSLRGSQKPKDTILESLFVASLYDLTHKFWSFEPSYFDLSRLRSLTLSPNGHQGMRGFIQSLPSLCSLAVVDINSDNCSYFMPREVDFGLLKGLEALEFRCRFGNAVQFAGFLPLSRLRVFDMHQGCTPSSIRTLTLSMDWYVPCRKSEKKHFWSRSGWKAIGRVLCRSGFPNLVTLRLNLSFMYGSDTGTPDETLAKQHLQTVQGNINRLFPFISKEESIQVETTFTIRPLRT